MKDSVTNGQISLLYLSKLFDFDITSLSTIICSFSLKFSIILISIVNMSLIFDFLQITFYPQREKFETKIVKESWPTINEEFTCNMSIISRKTDDLLKGNFISFTIYAILGKEEEGEETKPLERPRGVLKRYFSFDDGEEILTRKSG